MDASRTLAAVAGHPRRPSAYTVLVASNDEEVRAAQRLRHLVFAEELGAKLHSAVPGLDVDEFDEYCDHLVVREDATGAVVGTYRLLPPGRGPGRLYSETEFDLSALDPLRDLLVEAGRSCGPLRLGCRPDQTPVAAPPARAPVAAVPARADAHSGQSRRPASDRASAAARVSAPGRVDLR
jgi:hypothetical protein